MEPMFGLTKRNLISRFEERGNSMSLNVHEHTKQFLLRVVNFDEPENVASGSDLKRLMHVSLVTQVNCASILAL